MANPTAPTDGSGNFLHFLLNDNLAGGNEPALFESLADRAALIESSTNKAAPLVVQNKAEDGELIATAAHTADQTSADQKNHGWRGVQIFVDVTALSATPSVVPTLQIKDPSSGVYFDIAAFTPITDVTGTGHYVYTILPGAVETIAATDHEIQALPLPSVWRLFMDHADADSITYSVGFSYLP